MLLTSQPRRRLPVVKRPTGPTWLLGVHGGAGVGSLLRAGVPAQDAEGAWPDTDAPTRVLLVCRSHFSGLNSARDAAIEVARGMNPACVDVVGLVVIDDAPTLTRYLKGHRQVVSSLFARRWFIPWAEEWRHIPYDPLPAPPQVQDLCSELDRLHHAAGVLSERP